MVQILDTKCEVSSKTLLLLYIYMYHMPGVYTLHSIKISLLYTRSSFLFPHSLQNTLGGGKKSGGGGAPVGKGGAVGAGGGGGGGGGGDKAKKPRTN